MKRVSSTMRLQYRKTADTSNDLTRDTPAHHLNLAASADSNSMSLWPFCLTSGHLMSPSHVPVDRSRSLAVIVTNQLGDSRHPPQAPRLEDALFFPCKRANRSYRCGSLAIRSSQRYGKRLTAVATTDSSRNHFLPTAQPFAFLEMLP